MKTIEGLEKEYEGYTKVIEEITNPEEFVSYIDVETEEYRVAIKEYKKEWRENFRWRLEAQIRNFFFFVFQEEDIELYDLDDELLMQIIDLIQVIINCFQRMQEMATEDNYLELAKLMGFANDQYYEQRDYNDYKRDQIEFSAQGIYMLNSKYEDRGDALKAFLEKKVAELEAKTGKGTPPQYVKGRN